MKQFEYNPQELTNDQLAAIEEARVIYESTIKELQEEEDRRAEHYYDCQDEYSYGGLCSKVNAMARNRAWTRLQERIEEIVRGGYIIRTRKANILRKLGTGEVAAVGTHEGRYGRYFRTYDGQFISCAKKVSTYEKKGFTPVVQIVTEKMIPDGYWSNGDRRYRFLDYISIAEEISTEICY